MEAPRWAQTWTRYGQLVREGKLVPVGSRRDAFLARSERGDPPLTGEILAGQFIVVSVEEATEVGGG